jgi:hypothetical protein
LPWLEGAIKKHFPKANYENAARPAAGNSRRHERSGACENWRADHGAVNPNEPRTRIQVPKVREAHGGAEAAGRE